MFNNKTSVFILFVVVVAFSLAKGDNEVTVSIGKNATVLARWTKEQDADVYYLRCISEEGTPAGQTIKWEYGTVERINFVNGTNGIENLVNATQSSLHFQKIDYNIINSYFCVSQIPKGNYNVTNTIQFDVLVSRPISRTIVIGVLLAILGFIILTFVTCKFLKIT